MTAREMFEALGFKCRSINGFIVYRKYYSIILFDLDYKYYKITHLSINTNLHKAIVKQIEELGWLNQ